MNATVSITRLEEFVQSAAALRVDRDKGVIHRVKLLGWNSTNGGPRGRRYLPEGVDPRMYEGRHAYIDHAEKGRARKSGDKFGWYANVVKEADGVYGDLHFLRSHPMSERVCEAAERRPDLFGCSHTASGRERVRDGESVIEAVEAVESVDVVAQPATVNSLSEERRPPVSTPVKRKLRAICEAAFPDRFRAWLKEMDGDMPEAPDMGAEVEVAPDAAPEDQAASAFESMVVSVFRALVAGDLDEAGALAKLKDIVKTYGKLSGSEEPPPETPAETPAAESRRAGDANLQEQVAALLREKATRRQAAKAGVTLTEEQVEDLAAVADDARRARLIEALKPHTQVTPPAKPQSRGRDSTPVTESKAPTEPKALAAWLRG